MWRLGVSNGMARAKNPESLTRDTAVIVDIVTENRVLLLCLANISAKPVTDLRIKFNRKIMGMAGRVNIGDLPIFTGLDFLAPLRTINVPIDRISQFFAYDKAEPLIVTVSYVDVEGRSIQAEMRHNLSVWRDMPEIG